MRPALRCRMSISSLLAPVLGLGLTGCPVQQPPGSGQQAVDLAAPLVESPQTTPTEVGLFTDCTPAGFSDVRCKAGLRCGLVTLGDRPSDGSLTQCVPAPMTALKLDEPCLFDQPPMPPTPMGEVVRRYDRCGPGLGCVPTESRGLRCRSLCELRSRGACGKANLCALPAQVSRLGYCAKSEDCTAVAPQKGCGLDEQGKQLGCYVLTDDKGFGTFCMRQTPYGAATGELDALCERSAHCKPGLACTPRSGRESVCRPYCELPDVPDGGTPPDLGATQACPAGLGTCRAIAGVDRIGRCL